MPAALLVRLPATVAVILLAPQVVTAQWEIFVDSQVESECGIINAAGLEFAVRTCDGALVLVTGADVGFENSFVTLDGFVEIDGVPAGAIAYQEDADGFFTLWWLSPDGLVIDFDDVDGLPFETDAIPAEFANVPCDAAEAWDGAGDCGAPGGSAVMLPVAFAEPIDDSGVAGDGLSIRICGPVSLSIPIVTLAGLGGASVVHRRRRIALPGA